MKRIIKRDIPEVQCSVSQAVDWDSTMTYLRWTSHCQSFVLHEMRNQRAKPVRLNDHVCINYRNERSGRLVVIARHVLRHLHAEIEISCLVVFSVQSWPSRVMKARVSIRQVVNSVLQSHRCGIVQNKNAQEMFGIVRFACCLNDVEDSGMIFASAREKDIDSGHIVVVHEETWTTRATNNAHAAEICQKCWH